uniref:FERM and PDZ domain-containing protein 1 n=1 Tax=Lonchura striata TaxID=40157 RepID=UPI001293CFEE|nr:FERM and PDZ domain-containing protein 1 [Lonchura striata domestica]
MGDLETSLIHTRKTCRIEQMVAKWLHRSRDSAARWDQAPLCGPTFLGKARLSYQGSCGCFPSLRSESGRGAGLGEPWEQGTVWVLWEQGMVWVLWARCAWLCPSDGRSVRRGGMAAMDSAGEGAAQPPSRARVTLTVYKDLVLQHYGFEICPGLPLTIASVTAGSTADGKLQPGDQLLMINSSAVDGLSVERAASLIRDAGDELLLTVLRCTAGGPKSSFLTEEKRARLKTNPVKVRFAEEVLLNGHSQGSSLLFMPNVLKVYLENGQTKAFRFERSTTVKDIVLTLQEKLSIRSIAHFALVLEEQYNLAKVHLLHEEELIAQVVQKRDSHDYRCLFRVCFVPRDPLDLLQEDPVAFEYLYLQSCSDVLQERFAVEMKCSVALRLAALHIQERIYACAQPQKVSLKYIERDWGIENFISPTLLRNMRGKDIKKAISYHLKRNQVLLDPRQKHALTAVQVRLSYLQILGELKMYSGKIFNATMMLQDRESYVALLVGARHGVSQIINSKLNIVTSLAEFPSISRVELSEESERVSTVKIYLQDLKVLTLLLESNSAKDLVCLIAGYYRLFVDANASIFTWGEKNQQLHRVSAEEGYESRACSDSEDSWGPDSGSGSPAASGGAAGPGEPRAGGGDPATDSASEASDSATSGSRGFQSSGSSDSVAALEGARLEGPERLQPRAAVPGTSGPDGSGSDGSGSDGSGPAGSGSDGSGSDGSGPDGCGPAGSGSNGAGPAGLPEPGCPSPSHGSSPAGRGSGDSELVLRPPPGFGDSSSEEEFYDAADRLSPPEALAGYDTACWEGTENSCIPKRLRCYSLGEKPPTRERQGQEKELTYTRSLRKRRSFLKTVYTSQVSFPAALPGSTQRCCSWPPTQPSTEDTGKDTEMGIPAGTELSPDLLDTQPDTTEAKSVMEWLASSVWNLHHPAEQCGEEDSSPQPQQPPLLSLEPLPRAPSRAAQEGSPGHTVPGCLSEESRVPAAGWHTQGPQEDGAEVVAGVVSSAVACPSEELLLLPPAPGPSTAPPRELAQDRGLLRDNVEPSLAPCQDSKADAQGHADAGAGGLVLAAGRCQPALLERALARSWRAAQGRARGSREAQGTRLSSSCSLPWLLFPESRRQGGGRSAARPRLPGSPSPRCLCPCGKEREAAGLRGCGKEPGAAGLRGCGKEPGAAGLRGTRCSAPSPGRASRALRPPSPPGPRQPQRGCGAAAAACPTSAASRGPAAPGSARPARPGSRGRSRPLRPAAPARPGAPQDAPLRALGQLPRRAWLSPAGSSRFLARTVELQAVVGKLCAPQRAEQGVQSEGAPGWASQDLLSSCQALLSAEQPLAELQGALRAAFDRPVQLAVSCFQLTHCRRCGQRQQEPGAALGDVVGTCQQLVQALRQQLHGQLCPELGTELLARQLQPWQLPSCLLQRSGRPRGCDGRRGGTPGH